MAQGLTPDRKCSRAGGRVGPGAVAGLGIGVGATAVGLVVLGKFGWARSSRRVGRRTGLKPGPWGLPLRQEPRRVALSLDQAPHLDAHRFDRLEDLVEARIQRHGRLAKRYELLSDLPEFPSSAVPNEHHDREHSGREWGEEAKELVNHVSLPGPTAGCS